MLTERVKTGLKSCINDECYNCPLINTPSCITDLRKEALNIIENQEEEISSLNKTILCQMLTIANLRKEVLRDFVECITAPENITKIDYLNYVWISDIKRIYHEKTGETL